MVFKNTILLNVSHVFGMLSIYKMLFSCEILPVAYRFFIILLDFTQLPRCKNIITALRLYRYHAAVISLPCCGYIVTSQREQRYRGVIALFVLYMIISLQIYNNKYKRQNV